MQLSNTLTKSITEVLPLSEQTIRVYGCGPTVYDHVHIGNLRSFIMDDTLRRVLRLTGFQVHAVMNITDIDDKTIERSRVEHAELPPKSALVATTKHYEELFLQDISAVGVNLDGVTLTRATDYIGKMQELVQALAAKNLTYVAEGSIYFNIAAYQRAGHTYGLLSKVDYQPQARIDNDEYDKQSAQDFVLWKAAKSGEPSWDFLYEGQNLAGRPGWHLECSVMSTDILGQPFDIHTGGIDLIFPHHENEIAQSTGATGQPLAQRFVHWRHLMVDGKKMSKSLGNYYRLPEIVTKGFSPRAFRLLCLQAHYSSEMNFTWQSLEAAQNFLHSLEAFADRVHQPSDHLDESSSVLIKSAISEMTEALQKDLDSATSLALLAKLIDDLDDQPIDVSELQLFLEFLDSVLGLGLADRPDISSAQKQLIATRQQSRDEKDFAAADKLRNQLLKQGVELSDTPLGTRWWRSQT